MTLRNVLVVIAAVWFAAMSLLLTQHYLTRWERVFWNGEAAVERNKFTDEMRWVLDNWVMPITRRSDRKERSSDGSE